MDEKPKKELKGGWIIIVLVIIGIIVLLTKGFADSNHQIQLQKVNNQPVYQRVSTTMITLQPGEDRILEAFIGDSGSLEYQFEFLKYAEDSKLAFSRHGINGEFGGQRIGAPGFCKPARGNSITGDSQDNYHTYYLRIKNEGSGVMVFNFHLKGYRMPINLEQ